MKICMLAGNPLSLDGRVLRHAGSLARAGHHVTLIGVLGPNDLDAPITPAPSFRVRRLDRRRQGVLPRLTWMYTATRRRAARVLCETLGRGGLSAVLAVAPCAPELALLALGERADAYHSNDLDTLPPAAWAARLLGVRYVYDAHELYFDESPQLSRAEREARRAVEGDLIRGAHAVLTVNDLLADELVKMYGIRRPLVLHNLPPLVPLLERIRRPAEDGLRLILHGTWVGLEQAGIESLLAALSMVKEARLVLRGQIQDEGRLQRRITDLGLGGRVRLHGPLPGPAALIEASMREGHDAGLSVHVPDCKSRRYATSSKIFEYQMAGLAVIAADQEGSRMILDEEAGLFFRPDDAADLAEKLRLLIAHPDRLAAMQRAARRRAEAELCWEREEDRLLSIYRPA